MSRPVSDLSLAPRPQVFYGSMAIRSTTSWSVVPNVQGGVLIHLDFLSAVFAMSSSGKHS